MDDPEPQTDQSRGPSVKVARLIAEYGVDGLGEELERRWTAEGDERSSLRELADLFNRRLLRVELEATDERPIDGELENLYRLLTADDVSTNARTQAENRLRRVGIDPNSLQRDFVSHQAIHTYLTKARGVESPTNRVETADPVENRRGSIQRLRSRLVAVTEQSIQSLSSTGRLAIGRFDVTAGVTVHCRDCNRSFPVTELLDRGHCDCE